jgi:hypothetical protein
MKPKLIILLLSCVTAFAQIPAGALLALDGATIGGGPAITIDLTLTNNPTAPMLSWTQTGTPTSNAIWRNRNGAGFTLLATQSGALTTYTDSEVFSGSDYRSYKVIPSEGTESNLADAANEYYLLGPAVSYPNLVALYSIALDNFALQFADKSALTSVSLPALKYVFGTLEISGLPASLSSFVLPVLETVYFSDPTTGNIYLDSSECPSISFPALVSIGGDITLVALGGGVSDTVLSFPSLVSLGGSILGSTVLSIVSPSFPSLVTVGGYIEFPGSSLTNLSFPSLVSVGSVGRSQGDIYCTFSFSLVGVSMPSLILTNGQNVEFESCLLSAASVNHILARAVASNKTGMTINLADNAAPTGQGIIDKAALNAVSPAPPGGNTVTTN